MALPQKYDDGGYTGANMDRPALKRLLADIQSGAVNCVAVYKVDRLSRSLLDFARIMEILDKHGATFVSVTQQFNTTSSMGRLSGTSIFEVTLAGRLHPWAEIHRTLPRTEAHSAFLLRMADFFAQHPVPPH